MGLVDAAQQIEQQGRGPDTNLAHISPDESAMLDYMQGGRRTNPVTGLAEYSLFGKILKAVAKIGASAVGFMYGGPLGAAAASAAVSKLTGDSWKGALTTGAISGLTAGLGSYAAGTKFADLATTTGNNIVSNAASSGALAASQGAASGTAGAAAAAPGSSLSSGLTDWGTLAAPASSPGAFAAGAAPYTVPASLSAAAPSASSSILTAGAPTLTAPGATAGAAASAAKEAPLAVSQSAMNAAGAASPSFGQTLTNTGTFARLNPLTSLSMAAPPVMEAFQNNGNGPPPSGLLAALPYDPSAVAPWQRGGDTELRRYLSQQPQQPSPMDTFQSLGGGYADGGDVGLGMPPSAAIPQSVRFNTRHGGTVKGAGDGKSDDIPAMLSNGEHVFDAATVSDLGNGDNDTGQKRLEEIKQKIRSNAGRKNPKTASPKQKGLGSLLRTG